MMPASDMLLQQPPLLAHPQPLVVLRFLNGVLRGGEFSLAAGTTLFVASPPSALLSDAGQPDFPDNAIYVPVDDGGVNFEVDVVFSSDQPVQVTLNVLGSQEQPLYTFNTVRNIGGLEIAIRSLQDAWPEHILRHADVAIAAPAPVSATALETPPMQAPRRWRKTVWCMSIAVGAIAIAAAIGSAAGWCSGEEAVTAASTATAVTVNNGQPTDADIRQTKRQRDDQAQQQAHLTKLLTGAAGQYRVLPGRDGRFYVFASDARDAGWARQALVRSDDSRDFRETRVLQQSEERTRITALLDRTEASLAYHTLRLDEPAHPVLLLSRERAPLDGAAQQALAQRITALLPYAEAVQVAAVADSTVAQQAEAGLERLGLQHRRTQHEDSVTMTMHGAIDDGALQKIRLYVEAFYRQWGTRYVHFSVELADDNRKGKSFGYGGDRYLKSTPSHWDFSV